MMRARNAMEYLSFMAILGINVPRWLAIGFGVEVGNVFCLLLGPIEKHKIM